MTPDEKQRMHDLCSQIAIEKDPDQFTRLVEELNDLLEKKGSRLQNPPEPATQS